MTTTLTPEEFLKTLWGEIPPGKVLIWTLPDKKSRWYAHFDTITADMRFHEYEDVYTGIGLAPWEGMRLASNKRLREWEVAAITAFWADIDVAHPVHKTAKKQYPPSIERAMEAIAQLPFEATIIVNSGHGLQLWWVLKEVWLFADAEEREQARRACQWWHRLVKETFAQFGWDVDSTFDLPRVMRLPGTWNNKNPQDRRRVEVTGGSGIRYDREQFTALIPEDFKATPMGARQNASRNGGNGNSFTTGSSGLVLQADAQPSPLRLDTLLKLEPKFRATWEKRRPDLNDQSASAYDMALANFAVRAKWPDQEVANLLIAFRREHELELKLREKYYAVTIAKAHEPPFTGAGNNYPESQEPPEDGHTDDPESQEPPEDGHTDDPESQEPPEDGQADESPSNAAGERAAVNLLKHFRAYAAAPTIEHLETLAGAATGGMHPDVQVPFLVGQAAGALKKGEKSVDSLAALLAALRRAEESVRRKAYVTTLADAAALPLPRSLLRAKGRTGSVLDAGEVAVLSGMGGAGKSTLTMGLAMHIVALGAGKRGEISGIFEAEGGRVLMVGYEDRSAILGRVGLRLAHHLDKGDSGQFHDARKSVRLVEMRNPMFGPDPYTPLYNARPGPLEGWEEVREQAIFKPALIIIDPALCAYVGESNNPAAVSEFLLMLRDLAREFDCGVILVTHSTKAARGNGRRTANPTDPGQVAGSGSWTDRVRCAMTLTVGPGGVPMLAVSKANYGPQKIWIPLTIILDQEGKPIGFDASAATWTAIPEPEENGGAKPKKSEEKGRFDD